MPFQGTNLQMRGCPILCATMASLGVVCPLLGLMGISLLASFAFFFLASPLLLLFSPVLVPATIFLFGVVVAFAFAGLMAIAGLWAFAWICRSFMRKLPLPPPSSQKRIAVRDVGRGPSMVTDSGEVKGPSATFVGDELQTGKVQLGSF